MNPSAVLLKTMGCPPESEKWHCNSTNGQATALENKTYEQTLTHLLGLMRQGWAAKDIEPAMIALARNRSAVVGEYQVFQVRQDANSPRTGPARLLCHRISTG